MIHYDDDGLALPRESARHCGKVGPSSYGGYGTMVCTAPADHDGPCYAAPQAPRPVRVTRPTSTGEPRDDER